MPKISFSKYKGYGIFKTKKKVYLMPSKDVTEGEAIVEPEHFKKLKKFSLAKTDKLIGGKSNSFDLAIAINENKI